VTPRAEVLGCVIDRVGMQETLARVENLISAGGFNQHMAINTAKLVSLHDDDRLREIGLHGCSAILCRNGWPASI
jgi:N-acetylglucosaminyldiphosphoundecaprenol N-acetyl-beta-D-mannosaminyltransferase